MILMLQPKNSLNRLDVAKCLANLAKVADRLAKLSPSSLFNASWQDNPDPKKITTLEGWKSHLKTGLKACLKNHEEAEEELYAEGHFQHFSLMISSARRTFMNDSVGAATEEQAIFQKNDRILNFQKRLLRQWTKEMRDSKDEQAIKQSASNQQEHLPETTYGDYKIRYRDDHHRNPEIYIKGKVISISKKLFAGDIRVLAALIEKHGKICLFGELFQAYGEHYDDVHSENKALHESISRLRNQAKIKIINKKDIGYHLP
jgi:hypothetical protein